MRAGDSVRGVSDATDVDTAFRAIYQEFLPAVFGYARARLPEPDAEDVTAEVFATVLMHMREHPEEEISRSWVMVVVRNRIIDRWRRDVRWKQRVSLLHRDLDPGAIASDSNDRVLEALDRLSAEHRAVIILRYVDGASAIEAAQLLGRSSRAIDSLTARARRAFAMAFEEVS